MTNEPIMPTETKEETFYHCCDDCGLLPAGEWGYQMAIAGCDEFFFVCPDCSRHYPERPLLHENGREVKPCRPTNR